VGVTEGRVRVSRLTRSKFPRGQFPVGLFALLFAGFIAFDEHAMGAWVIVILGLLVGLLVGLGWWLSRRSHTARATDPRMKRLLTGSAFLLAALTYSLPDPAKGGFLSFVAGVLMAISFLTVEARPEN
jgi:protein-S-isoprenylcysteine O-methyltransferase Ste14